MSSENKNSGKLKFLILDNQEVLLRGMKGLINRTWKNALISSSEVFTQDSPFAGEAFDLIILDLALLADNNPSQINQIAAHFNGSKILIYSMLSESVYAIPALNSGACGYLSKRSKECEFIFAINTILEGKKYSGNVVTDILFKQISLPRKKVKLSKRELQIARMLTDGHKVHAISDWLNLGIGTVSTYKIRLFKKLNIKSIIELAHQLNVYQS